MADNAPHYFHQILALLIGMAVFHVYLEFRPDLAI